jgi:hypothetical protein
MVEFNPTPGFGTLNAATKARLEANPDTNTLSDAELAKLVALPAGPTFPPAAHTHTIDDVTGLTDALAGKAASSHTHTLSQITDWAATVATLQPLLVSGTNIKTINGVNLLGSGNIVVEGGGGGGTPTWGGIGGTLADQTDLQTALDGKASTEDLDGTDSNLANLGAAVEARWGLTPYFDSALTASSPRPALETTVPVHWPVAVAPEVAISDGTVTVRLAGGPAAMGTFDQAPVPADIFPVSATANLTLANMLRVGGAALSSADAGRTGYFVFTQDATGGRTVALAGGSHYRLMGRALGAGSTLPIDTAPNAVTVVFFLIVSTTRVELTVSREGAV